MLLGELVTKRDLSQSHHELRVRFARRNIVPDVNAFVVRSR